MFPLPCVIFAGGKSSRMGSDKALLPFAGSASMVRYQYERLLPLFESVHISLKHPGRLPFTAPVIPDIDTETAAPTVGFVSVFRALNTERIFILSVDTPFVDRTVIQQLLQADEAGLDAVIAQSTDGIHPLCGIYHRSLLPHFETMLREQNHRLGGLLRHCRSRFVRFDNAAPFDNLNYPHEYQTARSRLARMKEHV